MNTRAISFLLFVIGLFSQTQVRIVGSIAISELMINLMAPFLLLKGLSSFKREKVIKVFGLCSLTVVGNVIASVFNHTPFPSAVRGFATWYTLFSCLVFFYYFLRLSPFSFKWFLLGAAISYVVCIFAFQQGVEIAIAEQQGAYGDNVAEAITGSAIFWISRLSGFVFWPIQGYYLQIPFLYSFLTPLIFSIFAILTTASGRSAALVTLLSLLLIGVGQKRQSSMKRIQQHFPLILFSILALGFAAKFAYTSLASGGMLGREAQEKYEQQTKGKSSALAILMGGRIQCFVGAYAALKNPIIGYGPWAVDKDNLYGQFLRKYGNAEDYEAFSEQYVYYRRLGQDFLLPAHSCLFGGWIDCGIFGGIFWMYVIYLIYDCIRRRISVIPEYFGFFALALPSMMWNIVFSPVGFRIVWGFQLAMILVARAVSMGTLYPWGVRQIQASFERDRRA